MLPPGGGVGPRRGRRGFGFYLCGSRWDRGAYGDSARHAHPLARAALHGSPAWTTTVASRRSRSSPTRRRWTTSPTCECVCLLGIIPHYTGVKLHTSGVDIFDTAEFQKRLPPLLTPSLSSRIAPCLEGIVPILLSLEYSHLFILIHAARHNYSRQ